MSNTQTFFEQIPVETVKKICRERIQRAQEFTKRDDVTVQPPGTSTDMANKEEALSQH